MAKAGQLQAAVFNRWWQLAVGILAMVMIANLQYGWTLFVNPMRDKYGWTLAGIQWTFTLFVLMETWLVPVEGYLVDRFGPRLMVGIGGVLVGIAWVGASMADSLPMLYVVYAIGGIGAGIVYGTSVGNALKWFPDHRGLCAGLTAAAFGAGSALTVAPIQHIIENNGYQAAFFWFGLFQGAMVIVASLFLSAPPLGWRPAGWDPSMVVTSVRQTLHDFSPMEMLRTPHFWLLYVMFTLVATGGLMATAQLGPIARDFGVDKALVFGGMAALTLALQLDRILNGITRPFWGWVSDHIGREPSMFIAFTSEAIAIFCLLAFAHDPVLFVIFSGLAFFSWGEIYSLFPAVSADFFGQKFATTNYGLLYTAKGTASLLAGPMAAWLVEALGTWAPVFYAAAAFDLIGAFLAILVLRRMRLPTVAAPETAAAVAPAPSASK
jgi:OFA family oxalate/formate antiporter-like MFS transporter